MYTGLTAKLKIGENTVAYISNWSVEETRDIIEITKLGSKNKEKMPSLYSWSASADGTADFTTGSGHKELRDAMVAGTKVEAKFYLNDTTFLTGSAYVESLSMDISAEDKGNISISLSGEGDLALTTGSVAPAGI